jgi:transposase
VREVEAAFKKKSLRAAEQDRWDIRQARALWWSRFADVRLDQLVFIDEFGASSNMTRLYGRGPSSQRVVGRTPHGHWKMLSTVAALSVEGVMAACTFDGAMDTEMFVGFVEQFLVPKLKAGQVVVLDNLKAHLSPCVDALVEAAGARVLRLPAYSPDFNPIEMAISKIKSLLRKRGVRSITALSFAIAEALDSITPADAAAYMIKCGYAATNV